MSQITEFRKHSHWRQVIGPALLFVLITTLTTWIILHVMTLAGGPNGAHDSDKTLWAKFTGDPIAILTALLALFNGILVWVSYTQSRLIGEQVRLAREEFIASHRPQLSLSRFYLMKPIAANERPAMIFVAQNIGHTVAHVTEVRSASLVLEIGGRFPKNMGIGNSEAFTKALRLESGQREVLPTNGTGPLDAEESKSVIDGTRLLYFVGVVVYLDDVGNLREVGFCQKYNTWQQEFNDWPSEFMYEF